VTCGRSVVFSRYITDSHDIPEILLKVALNTKTLTLKHHSANVGFLITGTMLEGILRESKIIITNTNKNKVQILIRKIINANNMNSYKKLYIILMNISTMLKDIFQFFKGYSINNSITNSCSSMVKSKVAALS
jgi:arginine/lysine/ornithine decarboxylase